MKAKALVIATFCAALILVVGAIVLDFGTRPPDPRAAEVTASEVASSPTQTKLASSGSPSKDSTNPQVPVASTAAAAQHMTAPVEPSEGNASNEGVVASASPTRPTWDPADPSASKALEIPEAAIPGPARLPASEKRRPLLSKAPKSGTARGKLTTGFPIKAVSAPNGTRIITSSVQTQGKLVFVGLNGTSTAGAGFVMSYYEDIYLMRGWAHTKVVDAGGTQKLKGGFGDDSMEITIRTRPTGRTAFAVAGVFTVKS